MIHLSHVFQRAQGLQRMRIKRKRPYANSFERTSFTFEFSQVEGGRIVGIRLLRAVHLRNDIFGPTVYRGFKS